MSGSNEMVEEIICTLANISGDSVLHQELIQNGFLEVIAKFIKLVLGTAKEMNSIGINEDVEGIELKVMPYGTLNLIKSIALTMRNLSTNP
jgi:hypothetical protein